LAPEGWERLRPHLHWRGLARRQILQEPHRRIDTVHFIESGVASLLSRTRNDGAMPVAIIGRFGLVGLPAILGTRHSPHRCVMHTAGVSLQIDADSLLQAMEDRPIIRRHLMSYVQALLVQNSQSVLCNARHALQPRLCRWLLLARDRLDDDIILLTHDLLSTMLGVRRAGVTTALAQLERLGAIRRRRGAVVIVDRALLERRSCECYRVVAVEYQRLTANGTFAHVVARDEAE
jgi:CRP-like cAMP-binding protein